MNRSMPALPVHHQLPESTQTHVHLVDAIQPSHPLFSPSPPALNLSQHQGLFQWVSCSHQRLLFLPAILIPACASSSPAFLMMYSAYKFNKQGDNIQHWHTSFPIWNQSVVPYSVLTVASWPAYRFLKRQVRWSGMPISFRIFHSSFFWDVFIRALQAVSLSPTWLKSTGQKLERKESFYVPV